MSRTSTSPQRGPENDSMLQRLQRGLKSISDSDLHRLLLTSGQQVARAGSRKDPMLPLWYSAWDLLEEEAQRRTAEVRELERMYFGCLGGETNLQR